MPIDTLTLTPTPAPAPAQPAIQAATRQVGIRYYPQLIEELEEDHVNLLGTYEEMQDLLDQKNMLMFKVVLANFKSAYTSHLLKEAVRLYIYLRQHLKFDHNAYSLATAYKNEMDQIGQRIMLFIDDCNNDEAYLESPSFIQRFKDIGDTLVHRLDREETELYPLYSSSYT